MSDEIEEVEDRPFRYAVMSLDQFTIDLAGRHIVSSNKVLSLSKAENAELQKLMRSGRPDITSNIQLIDLAAAEKVAKAHMAGQKGVALQGAHNTNFTPSAQGKDAVSLHPVVKVPTPEGVGMTAMERLKARTGNGNAAQLDMSQAATVLSPEEKAKLIMANAVESDAIHPEDNDAAAKALAAVDKQH